MIEISPMYLCQRPETHCSSGLAGRLSAPRSKGLFLLRNVDLCHVLQCKVWTKNGTQTYIKSLTANIDTNYPR